MPWPAGWGRIVLDTVDSTNAEVRRRAEMGDAGPVWIMARVQTAGRGRRGRSWQGADGNLTASCLMRPAMPPAEAALHSFAAALAVADALEGFAPNGPVGVKWPNDVLLGGRKASGILLEASGSGKRLDWLCVGIGINVAAHPPSEAGSWPATSLAAETGLVVDPDAVLTHLAASFAQWSRRLAEDGFAPLRAAWLARAVRLGQKVVARLPRETVEGVFADLDADGALVLSQAGALRRIQAADVYFA